MQRGCGSPPARSNRGRHRVVALLCLAAALVLISVVALGAAMQRFRPIWPTKLFSAFAPDGQRAFYVNTSNDGDRFVALLTDEGEFVAFFGVAYTISRDAWWESRAFSSAGLATTHLRIPLAETSVAAACCAALLSCVALRRIARRRLWSRLRRACKSCGYLLIGNRSGICPECGTARFSSRRS